MNTKSSMKKEYNQYRFEVLEGHGTLYVADNKENKITVYRVERTIDFKMDNRTASQYIEEALLTNGWKHLRGVEDGANKEHNDL